MATTQTTLAGPLGKNDIYALFTAVTGVVPGMLAIIGAEVCTISASAVGNMVPLRRGIEGGIVTAHPAGEPVNFGLASDLPLPPPGDVVAFPQGGSRSFVASG